VNVRHDPIVLKNPKIGGLEKCPKGHTGLNLEFNDRRLTLA
jgi:hypothetical protein